MSKKAVIYARYSSDKQTEQSIEGQLRVCNEYATRNNIVVVDTYIDRAMTGTNDNRPDFKRMLKDSNKKAWDIVLVYKLDRFSRDKYETAIHKHTLRENGVKLVSAMENIPDTPEGIILESLLEGMNMYYSAELSQKVKRGMRECRLKGRFLGGNIIFGYKVVDKKIVLDEDAAGVVRYIFEEYAKGKLIREIGDELIERGVQHRGKPISRDAIYYILKNEKYSGVYEYDGELYKDTYPKIISDELFAAVRKKIESNRYGTHKPGINYLLREKIICGYCGGRVKSESGTSKTGRVIRYYGCSNKYAAKKCGLKSLNKEMLEKLVVDTTFKVFKNAQIMEVVIDKILDLHMKKLEEQSILNLLLNDYNEVKQSISNVLDAIEKGVITPSTKERLAELEKRKEELSIKITNEEAKYRVRLTRKDIKRFVEKAILKEPRQMIDILVKQIKLYNDKIEIFYNYTDTLKPDGLDHQAFLFYEETTTLQLQNHHYHGGVNFLDMHISLFI